MILGMDVSMLYSLKVLLLSFYQYSNDLFTKERKNIKSWPPCSFLSDYVGRDLTELNWDFFFCCDLKYFAQKSLIVLYEWLKQY